MEENNTMNILRTNDNRIILFCLLKSHVFVKEIKHSSNSISLFYHNKSIGEYSMFLFYKHLFARLRNLLGHYTVPKSKVKSHFRLSPQLTW